MDDNEHFDLNEFVIVKVSGWLGRIYRVDRQNNRYEVVFRDSRQWFEHHELDHHVIDFSKLHRK